MISGFPCPPVKSCAFTESSGNWGTILAPTVYELSDGTQVNVVLAPSGLQSFEREGKRCSTTTLGGVKVKILPLRRVIARKRAAGRAKDLATLPVLERTLRLATRLDEGSKRKM